MATQGDHQAAWNQFPPSDASDALGGLGVELDCDEDSTRLWIEVFMRCLAGGPVTSATCIGVTSGHSRL